MSRLKQRAQRRESQSSGKQRMSGGAGPYHTKTYTVQLYPSLQKAEIEEALSRYHFAGTDSELLYTVYRRLEKSMACEAFYTVGTDGVPDGYIHSVNQSRGKTRQSADIVPVASVILTLGSGPDRLEELWDPEERMTQTYMADCLCAQLLQKAYELFGTALARETGFYMDRRRMIFPGDGKIPLEAMGEIFNCVRQGKVRRSPSSMLTPKKSVAFWALLSEEKERGPVDNDRNFCAGCGRIACPLRAEECVDQE